MNWALSAGIAFSTAWLVFIASTLVCRLFLDRAKLDDSPFFVITAYLFPARKHLTERGQIFAVIRWYSGLLSAGFLVVLLILM